MYIFCDEVGYHLFREHQRPSARLQYLQCISIGDTAVFHQAIYMILPIFFSQVTF